ncbi:hypothetical protein [Nonlabens marinus]|uniref:Lipoprotein n=1 Tax=Nonlabens marinus S1-08 TaxID=1454201 RepID=W8W0L3_9FLAO|nr:hypothetical protein [Nonlabens marinus]BAO56526.1 hypothetical protein NMS_2517 [Nonlabens marinus S1-08]
MKRLLSILILFALSSCENSKEKNIEQPAITTVDKVFPEDFLGIYKGDLQITSSNGTSQIPMEFHLSKTDTVDKFNYKIFYGKERDPRNYNLERTHNPNLFLVDENNGIVLESAYADHTLYSTYEVMGNLLHSTEIFYDDKMEFMIAMARIQDTSMTGNEESAIVKNYPMSVLQRATLYKQTDSTRTK